VGEDGKVWKVWSAAGITSEIDLAAAFALIRTWVGEEEIAKEVPTLNKYA